MPLRVCRPAGVDEDGNTVYRKHGKPILPNHKIYNPSKEKERENYFYSLLLLFVPFHNEGDLIKEGETAESGVGGTGKSFLIKTDHALASELWDGDAACAVTAPTGLAAFNVGIHRLLQLLIEHEGRAAGYWRLGKDALKVMRTSLSKLKLLIIDEVSMVSSLNLAYIHLRLDEIFARDQWFGGVNILFVGDILQLPPVNGAPVFERICNKSITSKLGCMTLVNIWQDSVVYDELTINERQKKDQVFSSMLDKVRRGCPAQETVRAPKERVLSTPVVYKFQELMSSGQSPLCLFPTRQSCHDFNSEMLTKLDSELKEIKCVDEVDETKGTFKWSKKATKAMEKLNRNCNMTGGLEARSEGCSRGTCHALQEHRHREWTGEWSTGYSDCH